MDITPTPTSEQMANKIIELGYIINSNCAVLGNSIDALIAVMETKFPDFRALYSRALYIKKCITIFEAKADALRVGGPDALAILDNTNKAIDELKKEGKENGWQSAFNKAKQGVAKAGREVKKEGLEVVKK